MLEPEYTICPIPAQADSMQVLLQQKGLHRPREIFMRAVSIVLVSAILGLSNAPRPSFASGCRQLLESDVKIASMRLYADIVADAARQGWNYAPELIVSGSKRHFDELKLRLIDVGYEIVPVGRRLQCDIAG
ncbi:hypothetical protein [Mesorhizobium ciceri]|uniref:hypothetical protein n=1 Tax=Mesorhizobium TaxID=68287 RepID=UPI0012DC146B|nr:hypothetical protein [Mesorhizobium ciceri]